jgi:putative oxidoreductase
MSALALVQKSATLGLRVAKALAFLAPLATRIVVGLAFYQTGRGKWAHFDNTVTFFTEIGIPYPEWNAAFVATLELVGGLALILGLFTRLFATGLLATMAVALLTAAKERFLSSWSPTSDVSPTDVPAFVFLLFFAWLAFYGPGLLSLDALLARWLKIGVKPAS